MNPGHLISSDNSPNLNVPCLVIIDKEWPMCKLGEEGLNP